MFRKTVLFFIVLLIFGVGYLVGNYTDFTNLASTKSEKKEKVIKYWVAPMDSNYRRDKPGKSPMGMDLVPVYEEADDTNIKQEKKIKYWVAPMDANYRRDKPGKSPMGMDLVPVYEDDANDNDAVVKISPQVENSLGVRTTKIKKEDITRTIDTVGYATVDENKIEHITTYVDGWIRKLSVKTTGEVVKKGQLLLELYSPTLLQAQQEYLLAINSGNAEIKKASKQKLTTLGISDDQIETLTQSKKIFKEIKIYSDQHGVVSNLNVREGMYIKPDKKVMTIEDLSNVWVIAEVFERQSSVVKAGQNAIATFPYMQSKEWIGIVDYVYPELDKKTHTLKVRLSFPNSDYKIKPNMYANIKIHVQPLKNVLVLPKEALIRSGSGDRVVKSLGDGKYNTQIVELGYEANEKYVIKSGLTEGDVVVTSAQFLIDSESSINASFSRIDTGQISDDTWGKKEYMAMGVVKEISKQRSSLLLDHQEIKEISMPAMLMDIKVDSSVNIDALQKGDNIHFVFVQNKAGDMKITKIHILPKD